MNDIKFSLWAAGWLLILLLAGSCKSANESRAPVALTWEMGSYDGNGKYYENSFVLKNVSDAPIGKGLGDLLFAVSPFDPAGCFVTG